MTVVDLLLGHRTPERSHWRALRSWWRQALERRRQRRVLAGLDEHLLRDIGLTREQALAEAPRLPWRGQKG